MPAYFLFAHQISYITKGKPFRLPVLFHCLRLYEQKTAEKHLPFSDVITAFQIGSYCKINNNTSATIQALQRVAKYHQRNETVEDVSHLLFNPTKMYLLQLFHKNCVFRSQYKCICCQQKASFNCNRKRKHSFAWWYRIWRNSINKSRNILNEESS